MHLPWMPDTERSFRGHGAAWEISSSRKTLHLARTQWRNKGFLHLGIKKPFESTSSTKPTPFLTSSASTVNCYRLAKTPGTTTNPHGVRATWIAPCRRINRPLNELRPGDQGLWYRYGSNIFHIPKTSQVLLSSQGNPRFCPSSFRHRIP
jgi:hypothetical protein